MTTDQNGSQQPASAVDSSGTQEVETDATGGGKTSDVPSSTLNTDEDYGCVFKLAVLIAQLDSIIENVMRHMWREVLDFKRPGWPPLWLKAPVVIFLLGIAFTLTPLIGDFLTALGVRTGSLLSGAELSRIVLNPVRSYLTNHSAGLRLSSGDLWTVWKVSGVVLFVSALGGFTGGRIGWALFGALTVPMIWAETVRPAAWVAAGIGVTWWSILSIIAYGRSTKFSSRRYARTQRDTESSDEAVEWRAEKQARKLGYDSLSKYFDDKGNQSERMIEKELKISRKRVSELRHEYLPEWVSTRSGLTPGQQRKIIQDYLPGKFTPADLSRRHEVDLGMVQRLIERYKNQQL